MFILLCFHILVCEIVLVGFFFFDISRFRLSVRIVLIFRDGGFFFGLFPANQTPGRAGQRAAAEQAAKTYPCHADERISLEAENQERAKTEDGCDGSQA